MMDSDNMRSAEGILPKMSELYSSVNEFENFKRVLRSQLELGRPNGGWGMGLSSVGRRGDGGWG